MVSAGFMPKLTVFSIQDKEKKFTGGWERNKKEAEQAAALQAVLELCLMSYSECNIKNMTDKTVDETAWRDEIKTWSEKVWKFINFDSISWFPLLFRSESQKSHGRQKGRYWTTDPKGIKVENHYTQASWFENTLTKYHLGDIIF